MFNLHGNDRLTEWKKFRDTIEISNTPLKEVIDFWCSVPFVNSYLDSSLPSSWPDPWHLVLDGRIDDLAIILGMLYTLQLTRRFMQSNFEIHMFVALGSKNYCLRVDDYVLNLEYGSVLTAIELEKYQTSIIWSSSEDK